jgi:hypothetical protein
MRSTKIDQKVTPPTHVRDMAVQPGIYSRTSLVLATVTPQIPLALSSISHIEESYRIRTVSTCGGWTLARKF